MRLCALCLAKVGTSHRVMSYVTPHLSITPGTCTLSLTRPTSLSSDPLLGELQPCADLTITSSSPQTSISLNTRILPNMRIYVSNHCSSINRAWLRPTTLRNASRHLRSAGCFPTVPTGARGKCGTIAILALFKRKLDVQFISGSDKYGETRCVVVFRQKKGDSGNVL